MILYQSVKSEQAWFRAARIGDLDTMKVLKLQNSFNIDIVSRDECCYTALQSSAYYGHFSIVKYLVHMGADVNLSTNADPPLFLAACEHHDEIIRYLVYHGANVRRTMTIACWVGRIDIVNYFYELDKTIIHDANYLIDAITNQKFEVVQFLIEHGVDVNQIRCDGMSPLEAAVRMGDIQVVEYLVNHHADINLRSDDNEARMSTLYTATLGGHTQIVTFLTSHGSFLFPVNFECMITFLHGIRIKEYKSIANFIRRHAIQARRQIV